MKLEKLKTELEKAKQKAAEWQARIKDIERQITEQENLEIIQAVRSVTASPEELQKILGMIQSMKELPQNKLAIKEETDQNEEEEHMVHLTGACALHKRIFYACDGIRKRGRRHHAAVHQRGTVRGYAPY